MRLSAKDWSNFVSWLSRLSTEAGDLMAAYVQEHGIADGEALIQYAHALEYKYGIASATLSAEMYDAVAQASGAKVPAAELAQMPDYGEIAKAVNGTKHSTPLLKNAISRLVKQAGADTTLHNALRDGAEFAWVPHGDTCPFCIMLASRGWQRASKKALKNGHAEHIHANCDCTYAIRFNSTTSVAGYDPERYLAAYEGAEGTTPQEKLNAMRRAHYEANQGKITAQKRAAYLAQKGLREGKTGTIIDFSKATFTGKHDITWHFEKHGSEFAGWTEEQYLQRARELLMQPLKDGELEEIRRSDGSVSRYCYSKNEFVASTGDGNIRTFFKPKQGMEYWTDEHERNEPLPGVR